MRIQALRFKNFKAFKDAQLTNIPTMCVLVGENGTGKSTIFNALGFLKDALTEDVDVALTRTGGSRGFQEVRSRNSQGPIEIELKFRTKSDGPLITYSVAINEQNGSPVIEREVLQYRRGRQGRPWKFLDFQHGQGQAVINEPDQVENENQLQREDYTLKSPSTLAIRGLAQFKKFPAAVALGELISSWHVSDFHIQNARGEQQAGLAEHLSTSGDNLALVIEHFYKRHREIFNRIVEQLKKRIPGISSVQAKTTEEGRVLLKFQDGSFQDPFLARHVSDGTIKMLAYLVLLYDPRPRPLLCVEEPENQLYPMLLAELAEEFRNYAQRGGQVFISTHSPDFLNACKLEEVFWLVKEKGYTAVHRALKNEQVQHYMASGDQMGRLWKEGFFNPPIRL